MSKKNIAIFASGGGSNAQKMIDYFANSTTVNVALIVSNKADAGVLGIAERHKIPALVIQRSGFYQSEQLLDDLRSANIDFIVLAGFLWLIPPYLIQAFPQKMVNIHPALLPKYGGKGMYGMHVHEAVKAAGETETGITIHYVNEHYDEGDIVFAAQTAIGPEDSPADIAKKVQQLEHAHFPRVVEQLVTAL
jgi:phosphoribosylglycinamide formyltransferase 1